MAREKDEIISERGSRTQNRIIYFTGTVEYKGRAESTLDLGNYLLIIKKDGTCGIHSCKYINPINYMGNGSELIKKNNSLIITNKKESIIINYNNIIFDIVLNNWDDNHPIMRNTEKDLVMYLLNNIDNYFPSMNKWVTEYQTDYGLIDILGIGDKNNIIIEVKRKKATLNDCYQLMRYVFAMESAIGYLVSPSISKNAQKLLKELGLNWLQLTFDNLR